ncbi:hypothetical protein EAO77_19595 [Streptomyces sp. t39]|nr:hypothetical protein EAO77_19595 [Streptomyces sp. t39]
MKVSDAESGTPLRWRGGLVEPAVHGLVGRNTPAAAGRTRTRARGPHGRAEHPRVGGEDVWGTARDQVDGGAPPAVAGRTRGQVSVLFHDRSILTLADGACTPRRPGL